MGRSGKYCVTLFCLLLAMPISAHAGFFMLMDQNGDVSFTDTHPGERRGKVVVKYFHTRSKARIGKPRSYRFPKRYDRIILAAARKQKMDPMLVKSVIKVESDFNRFTVSSKGARGLMQLMPQTARELNVRDSFDAEQNINGGTKYLRWMFNRFNGNTKLALAAYNAGPGAVEEYGGVPPYKETIGYIKKVQKAYSKLTGHNFPLSGNKVYVKPQRTSRVYRSISSNGAILFSDKPVVND